MSTKLAGLAVIIGLFINVLCVVVPPSQEVRHLESFGQPSNSDYIASVPEYLCLGSDFQGWFYKSIRKVGYPVRSTIQVDFDNCTSPERLTAAPTLLTKSLSTFTFYLNWALWTVMIYALLFVILRP